MTKSIVLRAPAAVTCNVPFVVTVDVGPVSPHRRVVVSLHQKRGDEPRTSLAEIAAAHATGEIAYASFQVTLRERGSVLVLATAHEDDGAQFPPDGVLIDVL